MRPPQKRHVIIKNRSFGDTRNITHIRSMNYYAVINLKNTDRYSYLLGLIIRYH